MQYNLGDGTFVEPQDLLPVLQANTWYRLTLRVDDVDGFKLEVRERGACTTPAQACAASYRLRLPSGQTWRFGASLYSGTAVLDNYVEREDKASQTLYASGLYERETVSTTAGLVVTKTYYYQFGSQQTAMRQNGVVYFLHGDHLGSASLTTDGAGNKVAELRYYPFGETRYVWGNTPTDRRFTGQIELVDVGLYDYGARAYSPLLGRFISADTIVPQPGNPQSFNRYSYAFGNPLRFVDATGHAPKDPFKAALEKILSRSKVWREMKRLAPKNFLETKVTFRFRKQDYGVTSQLQKDDGTYHITLPDILAGKTSLNAEEASLVAHEVFHAYQREMATQSKDPNDVRNKNDEEFIFFSNIPFEREAYIFQYTVYAELVGIDKFRKEQAYKDSRNALEALQGTDQDVSRFMNSMSANGANIPYKLFDTLLPDSKRASKSWEQLMTDFNYKFSQTTINIMRRAGGLPPQ